MCRTADDNIGRGMNRKECCCVHTYASFHSSSRNIRSNANTEAYNLKSCENSNISNDDSFLDKQYRCDASIQ